MFYPLMIDNMPRPRSKVDMAVVNAAIHNVMAFNLHPNSKQNKQRALYRTRNPLSVKASKIGAVQSPGR